MKWAGEHALAGARAGDGSMHRFAYLGVFLIGAGVLLASGLLRKGSETFPWWFLPTGTLLLVLLAFRRPAPARYVFAIGAVAVSAGRIGLPMWARGLVLCAAGATVLALGAWHERLRR